MKKANFILTFVLMLACSLYALPSASRSVEPEGMGVYPKERVKIKMEDLPEPARKTLKSDAYKGWTVGDVYKTEVGEFEVELKKDETVQVLKFDKAGKVVK